MDLRLFLVAAFSGAEGNPAREGGGEAGKGRLLGGGLRVVVGALCPSDCACVRVCVCEARASAAETVKWGKGGEETSARAQAGFCGRGGYAQPCRLSRKDDSAIVQPL